MAEKTEKTEKTDKARRNTGHGHVYPRPDGRRTRCGGPGICHLCFRDAARAADKARNVSY